VGPEGGLSCHGYWPVDLSEILLCSSPQAPTATLDAAMAKRFATDSCFQVADGCLQLLGGYGYLRDHPIEVSSA
jgi:alkylation response protein AidB-like acyl-CoA dehydrogenase